jgi:hypothetical protein
MARLASARKNLPLESITGHWKYHGPSSDGIPGRGGDPSAAAATPRLKGARPEAPGARPPPCALSGLFAYPLTMTAIFTYEMTKITPVLSEFVTSFGKQR